MNKASNGDRIVFLGSGGARIVVAKQLRSSGGIWFSLAGTRFLVDPGPGALVRMTGSRHKLDPTKLAGILLSHRHLDHSGDVNNMIEAMTMGGTEPRGALFAPFDALGGDDPVVLKYVRPFLERIVTLEERGEYELGNVRLTCPVRHQHRGEVYGFRFEVGRSQKSEGRGQKAGVRTESSADYADYTDSVGRGQKAGIQTGLTAVGADDADGSGRGQKLEAGVQASEGGSHEDTKARNGEGRETAKDAGAEDDERSQKPEARMQKAECGTGDSTTEIPGFQEGSGGLSTVYGLPSTLTVSYIADTRYFPELAEHYRADVVIMNVVRPTPSGLDHLHAPEAEELVKAMRPKLAVLTHFGMKMLQARPWVIAREMSERTGCKVVAASDGMLVDLEEYRAPISSSKFPIPNQGAA